MRSGPGSGHRRGGDRRDASRSSGRPDLVTLYGWHPVREALANPRRRPRRLLLTENALNRLREEGVPLAIEAEIVRPSAIDRLLTPDAVHQGLYLEADPLPAPDFGALGGSDIVLVLDQITDPHNVGAIIRSAAAFAVSAVVATERHSPAATGVLAKAASGGLEHVPLIHVRNLGDTLESMGSDGILRVGLDSAGPETLAGTAMHGPLALVLGAEDRGLRQRTRSLCDRLARLDVPGAIKSLNVSNAAALALHIARQNLPLLSAAPRSPSDPPG
jgi:23S rRNA (guanosine2251-2'-O)-methyltransferase